MDKYNLYKKYIHAKNGNLPLSEEDQAQLDYQKEMEVQDILKENPIEALKVLPTQDKVEGFDFEKFKPLEESSRMSVEEKPSAVVNEMKKMEGKAKEDIAFDKEEKKTAEHNYKDTEVKAQDFVPEEKKAEVEAPKSFDDEYKKTMMRYLELMNKEPEKDGAANWMNAISNIMAMRSQATGQPVIKTDSMQTDSDRRDKELERTGKTLEVLGKLKGEKSKVKTRNVIVDGNVIEIKEDEYGNEISRNKLGKSEGSLNRETSKQNQSASIEAANKRQENSIDRLESRDKIRDEKDFTRRLTQATRDMTKDPIYKTSTEVIQNVNQLKPLIKDAYEKGGQSLAMLGPKVAKGLAGEKGVLTEQDVERYVKNPQIAKSIYASYMKAYEGKLTKDDKDNLERLANTIEIAEKESLKKHLILSKEQFAEREGLTMDEIKDIHFSHPLLNEQIKSIKYPSEDQVNKYIEMNPNLNKDQAKNILTKRLNP